MKRHMNAEELRCMYQVFIAGVNALERTGDEMKVVVENAERAMLLVLETFSGNVMK